MVDPQVLDVDPEAGRVGKQPGELAGSVLELDVHRLERGARRPPLERDEGPARRPLRQQGVHQRVLLAAGRSLQRLTQAFEVSGHLREQRRQLRGVARQDVCPQLGITGCQPGGVGQPRSSQGKCLPPEQASRQGGGDRLGEVADQCDGPIVLLCRQLDDVAPHESGELVGAVAGRRARPGVGAQTPRPPLEQPSVRILRAGRLLPRQGMRADHGGHVSSIFLDLGLNLSLNGGYLDVCRGHTQTLKPDDDLGSPPGRDGHDGHIARHRGPGAP